VKPEGFPVEKVQSEFLCRQAETADKEETVTMESLKLPADLVSVVLNLIFVNDVLGK
jgi:hypothetical protein